MRHFSKHIILSRDVNTLAQYLDKLRFNLLLAFSFMIVPLSVMGQGAWVRAKGETYSQLSFSSFRSDQYYNLDAVKQITTTFAQYNLYVYSEYGISDHLTIIGNMPLLRAHGFESTETVSGIGDLRVDAKYGFLQEVFPIAFSLGVEIPTAKANRFAENEDGFSRINLPTGDGEWNFWSTLAVSTSLHPLPAYLNLSTAYNKRTSFEGKNFNDQWVANLQFGYQFFQKLWLQLSLGAQQTIGETEGAVSFVRGDGTAFTQYCAQLSYPIHDEWGIGFQFYNNADFLIQRRNVYESPTFGVSVFFQGQLLKHNDTTH